jgi:hypothetical protein
MFPSRATRKPLWTVFHTCAAILTAYTALLVLHLEPLWFEMDIFITGMAGVTLPWSAVLLLLAVASTVYCAIGYFIFLTRARSAPGVIRKVLVPLLVPFWGGIFFALIQESATSLPSVCPAPLLYSYFAALSAVLLAVFAIGLIRARGTGTIK